MKKQILNISGYRFVRLNNLMDLKQKLLASCRAFELKGSILLAHEGINCALAGRPEKIKTFLDVLYNELSFPPISFQRTWSRRKPFRRMLVKVKKEIVTMGCPELSPIEEKAPYVSPEEFHQWIREEKDMVVLDTRKDFEVKMGAFRGAQSLDVVKFRDFPNQLHKLPEAWKKKPVVTYCTGGIRCEKAALLMKKEGFEQVYQLQGGIINYFKNCGGEFFEGECFVFDERCRLDSKLEAQSQLFCESCGKAMSFEEKKQAGYRRDNECPECQKAV